MRRAKLFLCVIAVFVIAGGSFAFKVKRGRIAYCRIAAQPGLCTFTNDHICFYTTNVPTSGVTTYCTYVHGASCSATVTSITICL
jgi:hypothetical protein